ncbi:hypothetical protein [Sorangium atrum]|uniref:Uncharacterized protein n=1 Tax=Sorangium atrum TaxID=2995308 RepID=A0ABT5BWC8_9BACT|nr:hypothetical protein [Sorangium aterium]MDC0678465.1 hypothetical protein [Sorangium aterium]
MDSDEASKRAARLAQCISGALNLAGLLASPRAARKLGVMPSREHAVEHLTDLLTVLGEGPDAGLSAGARPLDAASEVERLLALCRDWSPSPDIPAEILRAARDVLVAFAIPEPPGGWDDWEGAPPEAPPEPEDQDPRPPPTEAELAAIPDTATFAAALVWCGYLASPKMVAKIPPADLRRPALGHIDSLLDTFRPIRRNQPETRAWWLALLERLESFRALCEAWDGTTAPPMPLQEAARAVLMYLNHKSSSEEYEALDEEVSPFYLQPPGPRGG